MTSMLCPVACAPRAAAAPLSARRALAGCAVPRCCAASRRAAPKGASGARASIGSDQDGITCARPRCGLACTRRCNL
jgi:hypothetical protein